MSFLPYERGTAGPGFAVLVSIASLLAASSGAQTAATANPAQLSSGDLRVRREQVRDALLAIDLRKAEPPALPADSVVEKMMATSARRSSQLRGFRATRSYRLQYQGFLGTREAEMKVLASFTAPNQRDFRVVSTSGSKLLVNRVLLKLLDSEREAYRNQAQIELSPANYQFDSAGMEQMAPADPCYVLAVRPRKENKYLYRGKIWVDGSEFALVRMEGQPAKSPSFWIRDTQIDSTWGKIDGFWFIEHSRSVSHIRMGGTAILTIDYGDYQVTGAAQSGGRGQSPQLPDPSTVTPQR